MSAMKAPTGEQLVYLVWEATADRPTLALICTCDEHLGRYVTPDKKAWLNGRGAVYVEKVMTDHLYGANDSRIMMHLLRRQT